MSASITEIPARELPDAPPPSPEHPRLSERTADRLAIGIPTALAAVLCLLDITGRSIGFDEAATLTIAVQHGAALGRAIAHDGGNMSGFYVLLHVLMGWFGNGELVIRLPSALASVLTVGLTGEIARRLFGRRAAFATSLLTAVSLPLVFWAQNARGYALMVALVCAAYLVFLSLQEKPTLGRWVGYVVLMSLATYSSFVAVLVIPAQLLVLLAPGRRHQLRAFGASLVGIAVLCIPLLVLAARRGSGQLFWVPRPTGETEVQVLQSLTSAGLEPSFHATLTTTFLLVFTLGLLALIAASFIPFWSFGRDRPGRTLTVTWIVVPALLTFVYSLVFQPLFLPRNLLMSVPAVALLLGAGITHPRVPWRAGLALLGLLVVLRGAQVVPSYGVSPEPWQQASAYVLDHARPSDCIAFYPADGRMAFQYYYGANIVTSGLLPRPILPILRWGVVRPYVEDYATLSPRQLSSRATGCQRLWFVSSHEGQANGPAISRANRRRFIELRAELARAYGAGLPAELGLTDTKKFGYASAIHVELLTRSRR
jgi:mannosyltransferase